MAEQNNVCPRLLSPTQEAIVISIEQVQYGFERRFPMAVLKNLKIRSSRQLFSNTLRQLHRSMVRIVGMDEPSGKTYENKRRG